MKKRSQAFLRLFQLRSGSVCLIPFSVYANAGVIYDYFTSIAGKSVSIYEHEDRFSVNEDNFHVNEGDYKDSVGGVLTLGITLFGR